MMVTGKALSNSCTQVLQSYMHHTCIHMQYITQKEMLKSEPQTYGYGFLPLNHVILPLNAERIWQITNKVEDGSTSSSQVGLAEENTEHEALHDCSQTEHQHEDKDHQTIRMLQHFTALMENKNSSLDGSIHRLNYKKKRNCLIQTFSSGSIINSQETTYNTKNNNSSIIKSTKKIISQHFHRI